MLKFHFLGTLSGTEPFPHMHHSSWVLEAGGNNYWFDAGENCVHRAVTSGIDIMNTVALFISHPHLDHIGGMPNLLSCFRKFFIIHGKRLKRNNELQLFFSNPEILNAIKLLAEVKGDYSLPYTLAENGIQDGVIFEDDTVRITALHNAHLKEDGSNGWHSYSFLIESDGRRIVYSGDVAKPEELDPLIGNGCDMLIMETGHHDVESVFRYAISRKVNNLRLTHHGRQIIGNRVAYERLAAEYTASNPICIRLCYDGMTEEF